MSDKTRYRCAIYTRKSTDEGLDQDFNSLDAQREACAAYIVSQNSLGWKLLPQHYDDGGISGGHMDRPALLDLLRDIKSGKIDTVVVYKIDRLTRALADFSKMVEIFDQHEVSFVSVTQQFNTTTSMGRLTLNVLLSFAQFEREVTAERIRDKIAASRKKGMWMGGRVPLGYNVVNKRLVVNEDEAAIVRQLFGMYLEIRSVPKLKDECDRLGLKTKTQHQQDGRIAGGKPLSRGHLYTLLTKPIYIGQVVHRRKTYPGQQDAIIDPDTFHQVQALITANAPDRLQRENRASPHLLTGLLFDETGDALSPTHATKKGKRYRYYTSHRLKSAGASRSGGRRLAADKIEAVVLQLLQDHLSDQGKLARLFSNAESSANQMLQLAQGAKRLAGELTTQTHAELKATICKLVQEVGLSTESIAVQIRLNGLYDLLTAGKSKAKLNLPSDATSTINSPLQLKKRGVETKLVIGDGPQTIAEPNQALIMLIAQAQYWLERLTTGTVPSIIDLAEEQGVDKNKISRALRFAYLAPDITQAILEGHHPVELTADRMRRLPDLPMNWQKQRDLLGFC
jgi:DNA invertase Pin-like site-specific DNA recombinase